MNALIIDNCPLSSEPATDKFVARVSQIWSGESVVTNQFYRTGFEIIPFKGDLQFAFETVLSSLVGWDEELMVMGSSGSFKPLEEIVKQQGIIYYPFFEHADDPLLLCNALDSRPSVSHLILHLAPDFDMSEEYVSTIIWMKETFHLNLIVYNQGCSAGLKEKFSGAVDYMIGELKEYYGRSYVVARRSRLVQTEGNSRNTHFDLYSSWQKAVVNRHAVIEPMDSV